MPLQLALDLLPDEPPSRRSADAASSPPGPGLDPVAVPSGSTGESSASPTPYPSRLLCRLEAPGQVRARVRDVAACRHGPYLTIRLFEKR